MQIKRGTNCELGSQVQFSHMTERMHAYVQGFELDDFQQGNV